VNPRRRARLRAQRRDLADVTRFVWDEDGDDGTDVVVGKARRSIRRSVLAIRQGRRSWAGARKFLEAYRLRMPAILKYELVDAGKP
jgi:hypothetical protein